MRNEAKLEARGLKGKERFYYMRVGPFENGKAMGGVATICIVPVDLQVTRVFARGISFCNPKDQFNRKLGRAIALGRMIKALESCEDSDPIPAGTPAEPLTEVWGWFFLSGWAVELTDYEKELFEEVPKREADKG